MDSNSIEFLPAYFNIIECFFLNGTENISDIKKYLIVGLTNLDNAKKKKDDKGYHQIETEKEKEEEKKKKILSSRLELLFARLNLLTSSTTISIIGEKRNNGRENLESAIEKIMNSIIYYSEIYGPESIGLTPQYFFLSEYFATLYHDTEGNERERKMIVVKQIFLKIADIWKNFFNGTSSPQEKNIDLLLAIGKYYIKKIISKIDKIDYFNKQEEELSLKFKMILAAIYKFDDKTLLDPQLKKVAVAREALEEKYIVDQNFINEMQNFLDTNLEEDD